MTSFIRAFDRTSPAVQDYLHYDKGKYDKTYIGGICSLLLYIYLIYFSITSILDIQSKSRPHY